MTSSADQDFEPVEVIIHPEYNKPSKFQNDIAIIKLDRDIEINGIFSSH